MAVDGKVVYKIDYDTKDASQSLNTFSKKIDDVGKKAGAIGSTMTKNVTVPLMAVGGAAIAGFAKISSELDNIGKSAAGVNASVEGLQALQFAGRKAGIESEKMTDVLRKVQELSTRNADTFEENGIQIRDMNGEMLDSDVIFKNIIGTLGDVGTEQRNATLLALGFTRELEDMNKVMEDTEGFAENVGVGLENAISDESIEKFEQFNDQIEDIKLQLIPIGVDIAEELMPHLQDFADWLGGDGIDKISDFVGVVVDFVTENWKLIGVLAVAGPALQTFSALVGTAMKLNGLMVGAATAGGAGATAGVATGAGVGTVIGATAGVAGAGIAAAGIAKATDDYVDENLGYMQMDEILGNIGAGLAPRSAKPVRSTYSDSVEGLRTSGYGVSASGGSKISIGAVTVNATTSLSPENVGAVSEDIMEEVTNMLEIRGVYK